MTLGSGILTLRGSGAIALLVGSFVSALGIVRAIRRRPLAPSLPIGLAALVLHEAVLLPLLSMPRWLTPAGICLGHLPLLVAGVVVHRRARSGRAIRTLTRARWPLAIAPVMALVLVSIAEYPPNNWDGMTYHLARVAHWIENGSVAFFPTWQDRQNTFPPGAAYLVLMVNTVAGSDRLAPIVQMGAWLLLMAAAPSWARLMGAPRRLAPIAGILAATLPVAVLQACSTSYDLVASVCALAAARASLSMRRDPRVRDGVLLGIALGGAWLVKATAVIAALPFLAWSITSAVRSAKDASKRTVRAFMVALLPVALALGTESLRLRAFNLMPSSDLGLYAYPLMGEWLDRAANSVRAISHHLPIAEILGRIHPVFAPRVGRGLEFGPTPFRPHEDHVGNPIHAFLFLAATAYAVIRFRRIPARSRAALGCVTLAWVVLHALARDNAWISRLEVPAFVLATAALGVFAGARASWSRGLPALVAAAAVSYAVWIALRNELRTPTVHPPDATTATYADAPELRAFDDDILGLSAVTGCKRIGVRLTDDFWMPDPWDYPLMSRAREKGLEVRHVFEDDGWACVLKSLSPPPQEEGWIWSGRASAYSRVASGSPLPFRR